MMCRVGDICMHCHHWPVDNPLSRADLLAELLLFVYMSSMLFGTTLVSNSGVMHAAGGIRIRIAHELPAINRADATPLPPAFRAAHAPSLAQGNAHMQESCHHTYDTAAATALPGTTFTTTSSVSPTASKLHNGTSETSRNCGKRITAHKRTKQLKATPASPPTRNRLNSDTCKPHHCLERNAAHIHKQFGRPIPRTDPSCYRKHTTRPTSTLADPVQI